MFYKIALVFFCLLQSHILFSTPARALSDWYENRCKNVQPRLNQLSKYKLFKEAESKFGTFVSAQESWITNWVINDIALCFTGRKLDIETPFKNSLEKVVERTCAIFPDGGRPRTHWYRRMKWCANKTTRPRLTSDDVKKLTAKTCVYIFQEAETKLAWADDVYVRFWATPQSNLVEASRLKRIYPNHPLLYVGRPVSKCPSDLAEAISIIQENW